MYEKLDNYNMRIREMLNNCQLLFRQNSNIVGYVRSCKIINNKITGIPSLTAVVKKKHSIMQMDKREIIPKYIKGILTDVLEVGEPIKVNESNYSRSDNAFKSQANMIRPVYSGLNIGGLYGGAKGVISCAAIDMDIDETKGANVYLISTGTTLARDNLKWEKDDLILQPPYGMGGTITKSKIASVKKIVDLKIDIPKDGRHANKMDAGIARVGYDTPETKKLIIPKVNAVTAIKGTVEVKTGDEVWKYSKEVGRQFGEVVGEGGATINIYNSNFKKEVLVFFLEQVLVRIKGNAEELGALGLTVKEDKAFGILIGGYYHKESRQSYFYFSKIQNVENELGVKVMVEK